MKVSKLRKGTAYDCTNYYGGVRSEHVMIYQGRKRATAEDISNVRGECVLQEGRFYYHFVYADNGDGVLFTREGVEGCVDNEYELSTGDYLAEKEAE
jgi:hypothetical protein